MEGKRRRGREKWEGDGECVLEVSRVRLGRPDAEEEVAAIWKPGLRFVYSGSALPKVHSHSLGQEGYRTVSVED